MESEKLFRECYMSVYSYVMALCKDKALAEEITQNTFYKAMSAKSSASFEGRSAELTWLCSIAKNAYADELRRRKRQFPLFDSIASSDDVAEKAEENELSARLHKELEALENPYGEVLKMRVFGEYSYEDIAKRFSKTESWARVTFHRAKLMLKERMDEK